MIAADSCVVGHLEALVSAVNEFKPKTSVLQRNKMPAHNLDMLLDDKPTTFTN